MFVNIKGDRFLSEKGGSNYSNGERLRLLAL
jgi:hypothetical protein